MNEKWERWGAASGYLVLALGIAAAAFERGAPPVNAPAGEMVAFATAYRTELLAQSLLFVLGAGGYLWFFGSLRAYLQRSEGKEGRLSSVMLGAGVLWAGLQMVMQSVQITMALSARGEVEPLLVAMLGRLAYALSVVAYVPMAVMLAAVGTVSLRTRALPAWLGALSLCAAAANLVMSLGIVLDNGLLVPGGALTYVLYLLAPLWLVAVTTIVTMRLARPAAVAA